MIKVSQLPAATAPLNGADLTLVVQGGVTSRSTVGTMFASQIIQNFTGTGAQLVFTLTKAPSVTDIFINGVYQKHNSFTVVGTTLTFTEAPPLTSSIEAVYI
jgi:hypothetical protein